MRYVNATILSAADTASQNGVQLDSNQLCTASFHFYFGDATATGTAKIQASNDLCSTGVQNFVVTNWVDIPNATASVTSGGAVLISLTQFSYRWIRAAYTRDSGGSTTVTCNIDAIGV